MGEHQQGGVKMDLADVKFLVKSLKADIADLQYTVATQHAQLAAVTAERDELRAEATMLHRALVDVMDWVRDFDFRDAAMKTLEQNATYEELRAMGFSGRSAWVDAKLEPLYAALAAADAALADGDAADGR